MGRGRRPQPPSPKRKEKKFAVEAAVAAATAGKETFAKRNAESSLPGSSIPIDAAPNDCR